jgi:hypothetical protein
MRAEDVRDLKHDLEELLRLNANVRKRLELLCSWTGTSGAPEHVRQAVNDTLSDVCRADWEKVRLGLSRLGLVSTFAAMRQNLVRRK